MKRTMSHFAIALIATSLSGAALAGGDKYDKESMKSQQPAFSQLDTDQDGTVSQAEIQRAGDANTERLTEKWSELDTNQDGVLDRSEFARFEPAMSDEKSRMDKHSKDYDMNGDDYDTDSEDY